MGSTGEGKDGEASKKAHRRHRRRRKGERKQPEHQGPSSESDKARAGASSGPQRALERTPSVASMSQSSVGSYSHTPHPHAAMSGYVWLYPPEYDRGTSKYDDDHQAEATLPPPPQRVWMEVRLTSGVLVWMDASGPGAPRVEQLDDIDAGGGGGAHHYDAAGAIVADQDWHWGAARNNRLDLSEVRSVFAGRASRSTQSSPQLTWRSSSSGSPTKGRKNNNTNDTPYTFTVVTWGASLVLQAPNAYEFVGWLSTLRSSVAAWGGGASTRGEFRHPAALADGAGVASGAGTTVTTTANATRDGVFRACVGNDVHTLRYLLRSNPELVEATNDSGDTPMIAAARAGAVDAVRLLQRRGADMTATNIDGQTAVAAAAGAGHLRCVDAIVRRHRKNNSRSGGHRMSVRGVGGGGGGVRLACSTALVL